MSETTILQPEKQLHLYQEVEMFQVGTIKPRDPLAQVSGKDCFVPIFPFMYSALDYGELIVDSTNTISLFLQPISAHQCE